MDDLLDDAHWRNVQDPVKQMFLSLSKALRVQAASIRDLDRKCSDHLTADQVAHIVRDKFDQACSKQDATQLIYQLDSKVSDKAHAATNAKLSHALGEIDKLQHALLSQNKVIAELTARLDTLGQAVTVLQHPVYDQLYAYMDRGLGNALSDMDNKLSLKADRRDVETALPQRLEDLYRQIYSKYQDLRAELVRCATKEEVAEVVAAKADVAVVRDMKAALSDRVSRGDLQAALTVALRPAQSALASLDKQVGLIDSTSKSALGDLQDRLSSAHTAIRDLQDLRGSATAAAIVTSSEVQRTVEEVLRERRLLDVTPLSVQTMVSEGVQGVHREVVAQAEALRGDLTLVLREELATASIQTNRRLGELESEVQGLGAKLTRTRASLQDLSQHTAKGLARKVDREHRNRDTPSDSSSRSKSKSRAEGALGSDSEYDHLMQSVRRANRSKGVGQGSASDGSEEDEEDGPVEERKRASSRSRSRSRGHQQHRAPPPLHPSAATAEEMQRLAEELRSLKASVAAIPIAAPKPLVSVPQAELERMDWRLALGDLSLALRRDLSDRATREEVYTAVQAEAAGTERRVRAAEEAVAKCAKADQLVPLENTVTALRTRIANELTGARFLWTSGQLVACTSSGAQSSQHPLGSVSGFVPWDVAALNTSSGVYIWRKGAAAVGVRLPGLYQLTVAVFTSEEVSLQLFLNDEPLFVCSSTSTSSGVRRLAHSAGEVSSVSMDERVSLPAEAQLQLLYTGPGPAQGFIAFRKL